MNKRFLLGLVLAIFLAVTAQTGLVHADVNDFVIRDFQADYYLDKDSEGRSTLKTVETITAEFPSFDQNHGIERAIPKMYDGHKVSLDILSVKDLNGNNINYSTSTQNTYLVLRIGNADIYVHGQITYVITYTQRDVTKYFSDTKDEEFYWDTNGTGWSQAFNNVAVRLHLSPDIADLLTGKMACYYGVSGSKSRCEINKSDGVITANVTGLSAGGNMTIAVGFKANTFSAYKATVYDVIAKYFAVVLVIISVCTLIVVCYLRFVKGKSAPSTHAIIPEYLPPSNADVPISSVIVNKSRAWMAATIIDLAVRHKIKIIELEKDWWQKPKYKLQLVSDQGITDMEKYVINAIFYKDKSINSTCDLDPNHPDIELMDNVEAAYDQVSEITKSAGYFSDIVKLKYTMIGLTLLLVVLAVIMIFISSESTTIYFGGGQFIIYLVIIINFVLIFSMRPLSSKGRELFDYLKGLKLYIKIGEQDRLKVLQSPEGAEKTPIDVNDKAMLVHLYERVLPYAVLFGQEKGWIKVLGEYYDQQNVQPSWFVGTSIFNAASFSSALSSFSSSSSSSSGTGGSGGGGSSGGGGGGGGGGGW